jgi:hypothetical protein
LIVTQKRETNRCKSQSSFSFIHASAIFFVHENFTLEKESRVFFDVKEVARSFQTQNPLSLFLSSIWFLSPTKDNKK